MTTNGAVDVAPPELDMDAISWGEMRRYFKLRLTDPVAASDRFDELLSRVCPGFEDLPLLAAVAVVNQFNRLVDDALSGKDLPLAPSLPASDAGTSATKAT